jgi:hypothetical protein
MFDKKITKKNDIYGYMIEDCNNLFPTRDEKNANHQASKVYFGN